MNVGGCRELARLFMAEEAARVPGFCAAYTAGSANWMADRAALPAGSDIDIMVVVAGSDLPGTRRKFVRDGLLFEVPYLAQELFDPEGRLDPVRDVLRREYENPRWIRARCEAAREKVLKTLAAKGDPVMSCLFGAGITTHVLLAAGLRNPTVRRRYVAARELLADYGLGEFQETLLELLGSRRMSAERAILHATGLGEVFDAACDSMPGSFAFAADIQECARPATIDASLEMIAHGDHREAMFWIAVTWSRCMAVLGTNRFEDRFREVLNDLRLSSDAAIQQRRIAIERTLPRVCEVAERIIGSGVRTPSPPPAPHSD